MKFHCKNELSLLSFDEAVVKEFKIEKDTIQMQDVYKRQPMP